MSQNTCNINDLHIPSRITMNAEFVSGSRRGRFLCGPNCVSNGLEELTSLNAARRWRWLRLNGMGEFANMFSDCFYKFFRSFFCALASTAKFGCQNI